VSTIQVTPARFFAAVTETAITKNNGWESQASNGATGRVSERTHRSPRSGAAVTQRADLGAIGVLPEMSHFTAEFLQMLRRMWRGRFNIRESLRR
jgi:hypothetical protein